MKARALISPPCPSPTHFAKVLAAYTPIAETVTTATMDTSIFNRMLLLFIFNLTMLLFIFNLTNCFEIKKFKLK